jgi:hypothetical protein
MEKGLRIPQKERTKTTNSILVSLMNQLEVGTSVCSSLPLILVIRIGFLSRAGSIFLKAPGVSHCLGPYTNINYIQIFYIYKSFIKK